MKIPRQHMPEQPPLLRATNFTEVNLGYSEELARQEALRCLECAKPACTNDCPVGVKVKDFVQLIVAGDFMGAAAKIREDNVLPAITGRVCPQEDHCEGGCLMGKKVQPLGHRISGALRRRLRAASSGYQQSAQGAADRQESRHRGQRSVGPDGGRRSGPEGPQGPRVRGAAQTGRRAGVRHPRVPACPSRSFASRSTTCAPWAWSSRPTSSSARPSPSTN